MPGDGIEPPTRDFSMTEDERKQIRAMWDEVHGQLHFIQTELEGLLTGYKEGSVLAKEIEDLLWKRAELAGQQTAYDKVIKLCRDS